MDSFCPKGNAYSRNTTADDKQWWRNGSSRQSTLTRARRNSLWLDLPSLTARTSRVDSKRTSRNLAYTHMRPPKAKYPLAGHGVQIQNVQFSPFPRNIKKMFSSGARDGKKCARITTSDGHSIPWTDEIRYIYNSWTTFKMFSHPRQTIFSSIY